MDAGCRGLRCWLYLCGRRHDVQRDVLADTIGRRHGRDQGDSNVDSNGSRELKDDVALRPHRCRRFGDRFLAPICRTGFRVAVLGYSTWHLYLKAMAR